MRSSTPLPPQRIAGTVTAEARDVARITWWAERGFLLGATSPDNTLAVKAYMGLVATAFWPLLPVALTAQAIRTARPGARYYLSPARDAVMAVGVRRGSWYVDDHASARPGTGQGRALREIVLPALCDAADAAGIAIEATAVTDRLARLYQDEIPGLVDHGPAAIRGRLLRREPHHLS